MPDAPATENPAVHASGSRMSPQETAKVDETLDRLKASALWLKDNFWPEWQDAFRSYEVRTEKIKFPEGHPNAGKEDRTRTNVAMPEIFVGIRKKAVRKSRRPPNINVRADSEEVGQFLSKMATYQWDRANEQRNQRRHVLQGDLFGVSIKVHLYDQVSQQRTLRFATDKILKQLYVKINENDKTRNNWSVADSDDPNAIKGADLNEQEQAEALSQIGPEVSQPKNFDRFDGPISEWKFIGDWYPEPEFDSIHSSAWHIFEGVKDAEWLAYWAAQEYTHPETGERKTVLDSKFFDELEEYRPLDTMNKSGVTGADREFRQTLRDVIFKSRPQFEARLIPGRRYLIHSDYTFRKGLVWVRYIGNEKVFLGEMPLPWDLGGRYPISCYNPMPSLLHGIGDSTARKARHLWKLHNVTVAQRVDLVTNMLKKLVALPKGTDVPSEAMDLGLFRVVFSDQYKEIMAAMAVNPGQIPQAAFEQEQQLMQMIQMLEPAIISFGDASQAVPDSQKRATLGLLQQRSADAIGSDELEALNDSIAEETDIKLSMWQQVLTDRDMQNMQKGAPTNKMASEFWTITGPSGPDHPRKSFSDPLELQEDFEVFPEMGSTLALDDEMKKQQAQAIYDRAIGAPQIWNVQEAASRLATASGAPEPQKLLMPPPPPPTPMDKILSILKLNGSLAVKFETLPTEVQDQFYEAAGLTPPAPEKRDLEELHDEVGKAAQTAKDAQYLAGHAPPENGNGAGKKKTPKVPA